MTIQGQTDDDEYWPNLDSASNCENIRSDVAKDAEGSALIPTG